MWAVPEAFRTIYAHAVERPAGTRTLHLSGQLGVSPDGTLATGFAGQLEQAMANVEALLAAGGLSVADMVKVTYLLTRPEDLPAFGEIRRRRWATAEPPAVTVMLVAALADPRWLVEVEVIAAG